MANQTKQNLTTLGQIQSDTQDAYLSAPMIAVPSTTITDLSGNTRQMRDPSKTLRPAMGIERLHTKSIKLAVNEKGAAGEQVWKLDNGDDRVRFVGSWSNFSDSIGSTRPITQTVNDFIEITFYGTGLNLMTLIGGTIVTDYRVSVDGGAEGANIYPVGSSVLNSRNYTPNQILSATSGLALGTHTVKIRLAGFNFYLNTYGFEILNESTSINIPKGEIVSAGRKEVIGTATTTAYNSGFDGSPVLNGRGGRVVTYLKDGRIGKVIQQTNGAQANLTSADHINEEVIRRINFREFGANRADDFSTLTTASNRAFTLDNGTTTLVGSNAITTGVTSQSVRATTAGFLSLTFVGTGLDIFVSANDGVSRVTTFLVDGTSIGTISTTGTDGNKIVKIVSGLPYGTHTVRFSQTTADTIFTEDYIIYGPKKPSIPTDAVEIGEYYLMGNYANGTAGIDKIASGVLRKISNREFTYIGTWAASLSVLDGIDGTHIQSSVATDSFKYVFYGTGLEWRFVNPGTTATWQVSIDGATNFSTSNATPTIGAGWTGAVSTNSSFYGTGVTSWTASTGTLVTNVTSTAANGIYISGLNLGFHTVTVTRSVGVGNFANQAFDIITPIHYPNTKRGSLALKPAVSFPKQTDVGNVDLSKAKAWLWFDGVANTIYSSYNISAVLNASTGNYDIFFEKPFKSSNYVAMSSPGRTAATNFYAMAALNVRPNSVRMNSTFTTTGGVVNIDFMCAFFGELADEESE